MTRYIVTVRDHEETWRFYGPWRSADRAFAFAKSVTAGIEKWCEEHPDEHGPAETAAWAYVEALEESRSTRRATETAVTAT